ncbi:MAG: hypothetical protein KDC95_16280 [Planctomycetes bacterium]|nr:hypothetical protein [Planctomycetota bacterium]
MHSQVTQTPLQAVSTPDVIVPYWNRAPGSWDQTDYFLAPPRAPARVQYAYALRDFGRSTALIRGLSFLKPHYTSQIDRPPYSQQVTFALSHVSFAPTAMSTTHANNVGKDNTVVFSGWLNWPADAWRNPPRFIAHIPLIRPFVVDVSKGRSLILDANTTAVAGSQSWTVAATKRDSGRGIVQSFMSGCWIRYQNAYQLTYADSLYPGGAVSLVWTQLPSNVPGVAMFGVAGEGAGMVRDVVSDDSEHSMNQL